MNHAAIVAAVGLALAATLLAAPAQAQRVFVSAAGVDTNPCTFAAPCRSFAQAFATAPANGEIDVLDPGGYGALTINKAISIQGHGFSGISVAGGGIGITINASSTDTVNLNGLLIDGNNVGTTGIKFNTGKSLTVENCTIRHLTGDGIDFIPPSPCCDVSQKNNLLVSNTLVADNNGNGIVAAVGGSQGVGTINAAFNHVELSDNGGDGLYVNTNNGIGGFGLNATVAESVAANNGGIGFHANADESSATLMVFHCVAANNGTGLVSDNNGAIRIAQSMVTGNNKGWVGSFVSSYADNYIDFNLGNQGTPPSSPKK